MERREGLSRAAHNMNKKLLVTRGREGHAYANFKQILRVLSLIVFISLICVSGWSADVIWNDQSTVAQAIPGAQQPSWTGSGWDYPDVQTSGTYRLVNNQLQYAQRTYQWVYDDAQPGNRRYTGYTDEWVNQGWNSSGSNEVTISSGTSHGDATGTYTGGAYIAEVTTGTATIPGTTPGISGSNNTVTIDQTTTHDGRVSGELKIYTDDDSGNKLVINGNDALIGADAVVSGVIHFGSGNNVAKDIDGNVTNVTQGIEINGGVISGRIEAAYTGGVDPSQSVSSTNPARGAYVYQTSGAITGDNSTTLGGVEKGVFLRGANSAYDMVGGTIEGTGRASNDDHATIGLTGGSSTFYLHSNAGNTTRGEINGYGTVEMTNGGNTFNQYGGTSTANSGHLTDQAFVSMTGSANGNSNTYNLFQYGTIDTDARVQMDGSYSYFNQYGNSEITNTGTNTVAVTMNNGHNTYTQYGNSIINVANDDNEAVLMTGGYNTFDQYGSSHVSGKSIITMQGGNSLRLHHGEAVIEDTAIINLTTGNNNRFHQYDSATIIGDAVINLNFDGSEGNYFLMDNATSDTKFPWISSDASDNNGNVINLNGAGSTMNVFTQLAGRVSTVAKGSVNTDAYLQTAPKINLDGLGSKKNVFELDGDDSYNDFRVIMGSKTSENAVFHQQGGRKDGYVEITGGKNLFWLNDNADYHAKTKITSGDPGFTGNNLVVIDIIGHSRPTDHIYDPLDDDVHAANPGFAADATLDMSGTTGTERNNLFFANGDIYGTITTGAGTTDNYVYIGYTPEQTIAGNEYSWYRNDADYDLTGLSGSNVIENNSDPHGGPELGGPNPVPTNPDYYFDLDYHVNDTGAGGGHLNVKKIVGDAGTLHVQVTAGDIYNLRDGTATDATKIRAIDGLALGETTFWSGSYPIMYPTQYLYDEFSAPIGPDTNSLWHTNTIPGKIPPGYFDLEYTTDFSNNGDYLMYSVLNQDAVNVGAYVDNFDKNDPGSEKVLYLSPTNVTIGAIKDIGADLKPAGTDWDNTYGAVSLYSDTQLVPKQHDIHTVDYYQDTKLYGDNVNSNYTEHTYSDFFDLYDPAIPANGGYQAQITAGMVNVYAGSKLTIHPNFNEMGTYDDTFKRAGTEYNIIDNLNIVGMPAAPAGCNDCGYSPYDPAKWAIVTIDRTTIYKVTDGTTITHGAIGDGKVHYDSYKANVVVGTNGILQGFGEITTDTNHTPRRANVVGDVAVLAGGMLRPYDGYHQGKKIFNYDTMEYEDLPPSGIFVVHGNALNSNDGNPNHPDYIKNDAGAFDVNASRLKGVVMRIDGTVHFEHSSRLSTRLFADPDATSDPIEIVSDGSDVSNIPVPGSGLTYTPGRIPQGGKVNITRDWGDAILADKYDFNEIAYSSVYLKNGVNDKHGLGYITNPKATDIWKGVAQHHKVQYTPDFGFVNEIKSKLDYKLYLGDPTEETGLTTYYYQVAYSSDNDPTSTIEALKDMPDANHLFNRDIIFSDMLGQYSFLKQADDRGVVLRYRMVARHAHDGGIAIDMHERNAREAAYKLDEIRYPFLTAYNMADRTLDQYKFQADPSLDGYNSSSPDGTYTTPYDPVTTNDYEYEVYGGNPYDKYGFNGDIKEYYYVNRDNFDNYRYDWVNDIEQYFRALQLEVTSVADLNRAVRLVTPEAYLSMTNVNIAAMNTFITSRERNGVSALYLVENNPAPIPEDEFQFPLDRDMPQSYVNNPVRFWTAAMGGRLNQHGSGDEYGYTSQNSGMQLGAIKECGDLYLGLTAGYMRSINRWSDLQSKNTSDMYLGEVLLGYRFGSAFVELTGNIGYMDHSMNRSTRLGQYLNGTDYYEEYLDCDPTDNYYNGVYDVNYSSDFKDLVLGGSIRFGYQKVLWGKWLFLPSIGVQYLQSKNQDEFTESGPDKAAFRLVFKKGDIERKSLKVPVMFRLNRGIAFNRTGPWIFTPEVRAGVTANLMDRGGEATYKWVGNPMANRYMRAWGIEEKRFTCQVGASLEVSRRGRFYAAANYDLNYAKDSVAHNFSVQAGLNF